MKIREIQYAVCKHFGVRLEELLSDRRRRTISHPRQLAYWLCRELTVDSFPKIAREFGNRDHTTIIYGCREADLRIRDDKEFRKDAFALFDALRASQYKPGINIFSQPFHIPTGHLWGCE